MRLLVLGGGGFLGFHAVEAALAAGHEVTVFSRSGRAPVEGVEVVTGDRQGDLSNLAGREWDAAFDTFTDAGDGAPAIVSTADLLRDVVGGFQIAQLAIDSSKVLAAGLRFRSAAETAEQTLAWAEQADDAALTDGAFIALEPDLIKLFT